MKQIACETIDKWENVGEIDIVVENANMMMQNILACVFGRANDNPIVTYKADG